MNLTFTREQLLKHFENQIAFTKEEQSYYLAQLGCESITDLSKNMTDVISKETSKMMHNYDLRHSYVTRAIDARKAIYDLEKLMKYLAPTESYTYTYKEAKELGLI